MDKSFFLIIFLYICKKNKIEIKMKTKAVFFLGELLFSISMFAQPTKIVKDRLEVNFINSPRATIDSLVTEISDNYSYATFYVTVSTAGNFYVGFWLMGHINASNSYSAYNLMIDGIDTGIKVRSSKADWQFITLSGNTTITLTTGNHRIGLRGLKSDIPNVEILRLSKTPVLTGFEDAKYQYAKNNHSPYNNQVTPQIFDNYTEISYNVNVNVNDPLLPPSIYNGKFCKYIFYTFYRLHYFEQGETASFSTEMIGGKHHYLHLISLSNPSAYSWVESSVSNGYAILTQTIPATGFYYVMVRALEPEGWGTCNLTVNGNYRFENVPIVNHVTEVPPISSNNANSIHANFVVSSRINPMVWLINTSDVVVNWNDNYPYNETLSSFDWQTNARINQKLINGMNVLATLEKSYQNGDFSIADIYAGCRIRYWDTWDDFPELKKDDQLITGEADISYNCLAWALGEWSSNFYFSKLYGTNVQIHSVEILDSVCAEYGYTRVGATETNSQIDLWAKVENGVWDCQHFSVKSRVHRFAGGYDWESKMGGSNRILHPRNDLRNGFYGNIVAHYRKDETSDLIGNELRCFENISFTDKEKDIIKEKISQIPNNVIRDFSRLYEACEKDGMEKLTLFIDVFQKAKDYDGLINICKKNPLLQFLIFKKVDEGDVLAIQLMEDLVARSNISLFKKVQSENSKRKVTKEGYRIVRTLQANSILFIKAYLAESLKSEFQIEQSITYSNANMFRAVAKGKELFISFNLEDEAFVSATIANTLGTYIRNIENRKYYEAGNFVIQTSVPVSGIYIMNVSINGRNYEKVISVK